MEGYQHVHVPDCSRIQEFFFLNRCTTMLLTSSAKCFQGWPFNLHLIRPGNIRGPNTKRVDVRHTNMSEAHFVIDKEACTCLPQKSLDTLLPASQKIFPLSSCRVAPSRTLPLLWLPRMGIGWGPSASWTKSHACLLQQTAGS